MNLRVKFNLAITASCLICAATTFWMYSTSIHEYKNTIILNKAQYILDLSESLKTYNDTQVKPLLIESSQENFIKQTVSAYALSSVFTGIKTLTGLTQFKIVFKDSQLPLYKGNNWQKQIVDFFINNSDKNTYSASQSDEHGQFRIMAVPIIENGNTIGAKIVSIYNTHYDDAEKKQLNDFLIILIIVVAMLVIILNILFHFIFFKPMRLLIDSSKDLSHGHSDIELKIDSGAEFNHIADSFNRMQRSLKAAITMMSR